ncbi:MAG: hypothetical protein HPY45_13680 [Anaerolineae bacterium]|nr:hypothetical protein [Anaerolineae bacterium]
MKKILTLLYQIALLTLALFAAFIVAGLIPAAVKPLSPAEAAKAPAALLGASFLMALASIYPFLRSRWHGWKLAAVMTLVLFSITQVLTLIETLLFAADVGIPPAVQVMLTLRGLVRSLVFSVLAVLIVGRWRAAARGAAGVRFGYNWKGWLWRLALLAVLFVGIYYACGYLIAWRSAAVRAYYAGGQNISLWKTIPVQLGRGLLWALTALPVIKMLHGRRLENALTLAVLFGVNHSVLLLIPNPYIPAAVAQVHLVELLVSIGAMGLLCGLVLHARPNP